MSADIIVEGNLEPPSPDDYSGVAIPFEATKIGETAVLRVCGELADMAQEFARLFCGDETSEEAEAWITKSAAPILQKAGLIPSGECGRLRVLEFDPSRPHRADTSNVAAFDPHSGFENLTTFELDAYYRIGLPCYVAIHDGKIVSAAVQSPGGEDDEVAEIGVETAPDYEGRGYARGCVRALATELHRRGMRVVYIAQEICPASIAVAHAAGFTEHGSILQLIFIPADSG